MRLHAVTGTMLLSVACLMFLGGCSRERIDWKSAEAADTQESWNHFLELHPTGDLATQARARLAQIAEDKDWRHTTAADTADAYKQFLAQHPQGKWAEEARIRIENFSLDANSSPTGDTRTAQPATASSSTTAAPGTRAEPPVVSPRSETPPIPSTAATASDSSRRPSSETPSPSVKSSPAVGGSSAPKPAAALPPSPPGFGIQLGAFSSQSAALTEWKRLQVKFDPQLHGLFAHAVPADITSGKVFRLQSPVGDESRARSICAALTQQSQPCVVVLPNSP